MLTKAGNTLGDVVETFRVQQTLSVGVKKWSVVKLHLKPLYRKDL